MKAISVSQNNVVVAITLQDEDENKRLSDNASIKNLKLVDNVLLIKVLNFLL